MLLFGMVTSSDDLPWPWFHGDLKSCLVLLMHQCVAFDWFCGGEGVGRVRGLYTLPTKKQKEDQDDNKTQRAIMK